MNKIDLYKGDCSEVMDRLIAEGIVVDAIICDVPFQITACAWDTLIPFNNHIMVKKGKKEVPMYEDDWVLQQGYSSYKSVNLLRDEFNEISKEGMWQKLNKLIKPNGAIVLFGSEPFSSALRMSNIKNYKYDWVWEKTSATGYLNAKKMPMKANELISVFYSMQPTYNPQKTRGHTRKVSTAEHKRNSKKTDVYGEHGVTSYDSTERYPRTVIRFKTDKQSSAVHPTQKPVALMEYLIKTYTNENELVLDFTCGSGTTGVACKKLNRNFIGIDNGVSDKKGEFFGWHWIDVTKKRIEDTSVEKGLFDE